MEIPLFPLNAVLFPGASMPLHIFEERYKEMIARCLDDGRPFGVVLIRQGNEVGEPAVPFDIGTTAHIAQVERLPEGRMNLTCHGGQRFRTLRVVQDVPYLVGEIELLHTVEEGDAEIRGLAAKAGSLVAEYTRLYLAVSNQWARSIEMPSAPDALADFIGSRLGVSLWAKQLLLEELSARSRLAMEVDMLGDAIREISPQVESARTARWHGFGVMS